MQYITSLRVLQLISVYIGEQSAVVPHCSLPSKAWVEALPFLPFDPKSIESLGVALEQGRALSLGWLDDTTPAYPEEVLSGPPKFWLVKFFDNQSAGAFPMEAYQHVMEEGEVLDWRPAQGQFFMERVQYSDLASQLLLSPKPLRDSMVREPTYRIE